MDLLDEIVDFDILCKQQAEISMDKWHFLCHLIDLVGFSTVLLGSFFLFQIK